MAAAAIAELEDRVGECAGERSAMSSQEESCDSITASRDGRCRLRGRSRGTTAHPLASSKSKFEKSSDRLRISVEGEDLAAEFIGTPAAVEVGGHDLGTVEIVCLNPLADPPCTLGGFDLNLDNRDGDIVPDLVGAGSCRDATVPFVVKDENGDVIGTSEMKR